MIINRCAVLLGNGDGLVLAPTVNHNSFVTKVQAVDTVRNIVGFISGNRDRAQLWHFRLLSNKLASVHVSKRRVQESQFSGHWTTYTPNHLAGE
jgi:hypothetical protein